ncbi:hypothetical protein JCM8547_004454 [Rhodosporidiobolus lusitaniae]
MPIIRYKDGSEEWISQEEYDLVYGRRPTTTTTSTSTGHYPAAIGPYQPDARYATTVGHAGPTQVSVSPLEPRHAHGYSSDFYDDSHDTESPIDIRGAFGGPPSSSRGSGTAANRFLLGSTTTRPCVFSRPRSVIVTVADLSRPPSSYNEPSPMSPGRRTSNTPPRHSQHSQHSYHTPSPNSRSWLDLDPSSGVPSPSSAVSFALSPGHSGAGYYYGPDFGSGRDATYHSDEEPEHWSSAPDYKNYPRR